MATKKSNSRKSHLDQDLALIAGTKKYLMAQSFLIGKKQCSPQDVIDVLQACATTAQAVDAARALWLGALKADKDERASAATFTRAFRKLVLAMFEQHPETLAEFGLTPPKPKKVSVATKSTAILKNKATRKARGTMGSKERLKVKGELPPTPPADGGGAHVPPPVPVAGGKGVPQQG